MDEKKYEIIGKVEIGTDEYRDLIKTSVENEKNADTYRSKCWKYEDEIKELKKKIATLEESISHYTNFVNSDDEVKISYRMYIRNLGDSEI